MPITTVLIIVVVYKMIKAIYFSLTSEPYQNIWNYRYLIQRKKTKLGCPVMAQTDQGIFNLHRNSYYYRKKTKTLISPTSNVYYCSVI